MAADGSTSTMPHVGRIRLAGVGVSGAGCGTTQAGRLGVGGRSTAAGSGQIRALREAHGVGWERPSAGRAEP
jgi:hypothetical protein